MRVIQLIYYGFSYFDVLSCELCCILMKLSFIKSFFQLIEGFQQKIQSQQSLYFNSLRDKKSTKKQNLQLKTQRSKSILLFYVNQQLLLRSFSFIETIKGTLRVSVPIKDDVKGYSEAFMGPQMYRFFMRNHIFVFYVAR